MQPVFKYALDLTLYGWSINKTGNITLRQNIVPTFLNCGVYI